MGESVIVLRVSYCHHPPLLPRPSTVVTYPAPYRHLNLLGPLPVAGLMSTCQVRLSPWICVVFIYPRCLLSTPSYPPNPDTHVRLITSQGLGATSLVLR